MCIIMQLSSFPLLHDISDAQQPFFCSCLLIEDSVHHSMLFHLSQLTEHRITPQN